MDRIDLDCGCALDPDGATRCDRHQNGDPHAEFSQDDLIRATNAARIAEHLRHRLMVRNAMDEAERKAWDAFSRYKFIMGGYHAAQWVLLNKLLEDTHQPSPFTDLVKLAREHTVKD